MKLSEKITKRLNIIGLILVWIIASAIFGFFTFISLFLLLLPLQVILVYIFDSLVKVEKKVLISRLLALTGFISFIIALLVEMPLWYKLILLFAQGSFLYAEIKMWLEARK
ncbi:hypothetical protein PAECIP111892_04287 [Paenibacillus auburnensis]|uniref:Uncharacterized protein n=1 Tax=Paenibacillus auburnensis TaxID=2905649 RepID=A0ABM9CMC8_9BACL|nr:hypothetical protein [Paenibacillus auburnensis]CAH1216310.1 hypothetical protein PAECIP111892_04287 [Paenibacillus auburnensis]